MTKPQRAPANTRTTKTRAASKRAGAARPRVRLLKPHGSECVARGSWFFDRPAVGFESRDAALRIRRNRGQLVILLRCSDPYCAGSAIANAVDVADLLSNLINRAERRNAKTRQREPSVGGS